MSPDKKTQCQLELLFHTTKHFKVKKWVRSQTALNKTVTFDKLLQHAKQHEATVKDFQQHKSNRGVAMATTINEIRTFKQRKGQGQTAKSKGKICSKCGMPHPPRECPAWAKSVTSVAIKTTSVHNVGLSSQEPGTESPTAHPEDARAEVSYIIPGLEASWQPKVPTAWSQSPFKTIQMTSMEKTQMTSMEKEQTSMDIIEETSMEPPFKMIQEILNFSNSHFLPFPGQSLWPA